MRTPSLRLVVSCAVLLLTIAPVVVPLLRAESDEIHRFRDGVRTRWSSPENPPAAPGRGGTENNGAKGRAFVSLPAGATHVLLDTTGSGIVTRIWLTVMDRSPEMLRSLKLEMYWDNHDKPAVAVPLGDFFGVGLGRTARFENALFASPEGRSFTCLIPMPFRTAARIQVTNEAGRDLSHLFFDVNFLSGTTWNEHDLYFHAYWSRDPATTLGRDFELLPRIEGRGRFLGVNVGVNANPVYEETWWGEGEVKVFLDGDGELPTLVGTGTEDYIGTGWGQGEYANRYSGCLVADEAKRQWALYRFHLPDPIFFTSGCRVTLQQIGGGMKDKVAALERAGAPLIPVTLDQQGRLTHLYREGQRTRVDDPNLPDGWINYYRSDDVSATAYFFLDTPANGLPPLAPVEARVVRLEGGASQD